jgi:Flp pilus assembly secretin CpaC
MKTRHLQFLVRFLCAVAAVVFLISAPAGCKPPPKPTPKPVAITVELQVFSMARTQAVETVFAKPTGTNFADVLRTVEALVAAKKATLVATPSVTTMSGEKATIESLLEHRYPTEFEPPQIPQQIGTGGTTTKVTTTTSVTEETTTVPRTSSTPTAFDTRNMGLTLEVEPVASEDRKEIHISLVPQIVALQGTVKYKTDNNGEIEQPEFYTKKIRTAVLVKNGGIAFLGTLEPDRTLSKGEDLTEVIFLRATVR